MNTIVLNLLRTVAILLFGALAAFSQADHDLKELDRPHWGGMAVFAAWAALGALVGSFGNAIATFFVVAFSVAAAVLMVGRSDNLAIAIIGACGLHIVSPLLAGQPFHWDGWTTAVAVMAVLGIIALAGIHVLQKRRGLVEEGPNSPDRNPMILPVCILAVVLFVGAIVRIFLPR